MSAAGEPPRLGADAQEAAVIDVGSNSVRMVVYRIDGRALLPALNEKVMAGLGRGVSSTGELPVEGVKSAMEAMRRFAVLIDSLGIRHVYAVATSAVREAVDGGEFANAIAAETGINLRILSGEEEARLSALGVQAGAPQAEGLVGDLGGASLEFIRLSLSGPGEGASFRIGPLALMRGEPFDPKRIADEVDAAIADNALLLDGGRDFHAVGGAWRALGRIDIAHRDHPIGVLHQHEMLRGEILKVADFVRRQSRRSLERLEEAAARRADTLPYAAIVLERVMHFGKFDRVLISAYGLREGVLIDQMSAEALRADPLVSAAEAIAGRHPRTREFGRALERWISPMFEASPPTFSKVRDASLRSAAARLADVGGLFHPDQRVEIMYDLVLRAPLAALSHPERAFLAAAIHHRYAKAAPKHAAAYFRLLSDEQRAGAAALGAALRLGADLSGRSEGLLAKCAIAVEGDALVLRANPGVANLLTDQVTKRLEAAAASLGLRAIARLD